jgi:hypothetical protein
VTGCGTIPMRPSFGTSGRPGLALPPAEGGELLYRVKGEGETFQRVANTYRDPALRCDV